MIGFRIQKRERVVSPETVDRFRSLPVANVSDVMSRMSAGGPRVRPMHAGRPMVGPALTVKTRPGDNLMVHKALMIASPGDVIVVDAGGDLTNAIVGEIMIAEAESRGIEGVVIFGAIRDSGSIRLSDFPVFASGVTHRGPYKDGPGEINVPIAIDGMTINPGDLIMGDPDGILSVPFEAVDTIFSLADKKNQVEEKSLADIRSGANRKKDWVDETLRRLGCENLE